MASGRRGFIGSAIGLLIVGPWQSADEHRFTLFPNGVEDWKVVYDPTPTPMAYTFTYSDGSTRQVSLMPGDTFSSVGLVSVEGRP